MNKHLLLMSSNGSTSYVALFNCYQLCQRAKYELQRTGKTNGWIRYLRRTEQTLVSESFAHPFTLNEKKKQFTLPVCFGRIAFFEVVPRGENDFFFSLGKAIATVLFLIKTLIGHQLLLSRFLGRVYLQGHDRFVIKATDYFNWKYSRVISYRRV